MISVPLLSYVYHVCSLYFGALRFVLKDDVYYDFHVYSYSVLSILESVAYTMLQAR